MPTIGLLTRRLSEALGVEEKTVKIFVRSLRDEGWLTTGARGINAPDMTFLDAARILIALLVTDKPSAACDAINDFGKLIVGDKTGDTSDTTRKFEAILAKNAKKIMTLENCAAALIQIYSEAPELNDIWCEIRIKPSSLAVQLRLGEVCFSSKKTPRVRDYNFATGENCPERFMGRMLKAHNRWKSRIQVERYIRTTEIEDIAAAFKTRGAPNASGGPTL